MTSLARRVLPALALSACSGDSVSRSDIADAIVDAAVAEVSTDTSDAVADTGPVTYPGFQVVGPELFDATGAPFVMRGVNNPHIWWDATSFAALDAIAAAGANTVRVVWQIDGEPGRLREILARAVALELVPMVELHDVTGDDDPVALAGVVDYWVRPDVVAVLAEFRREALVNVANEWGDNDLDPAVWRDAYIAAVTRMRAAGLAHTIVVDGDGWGQNIEAIQGHGAAVLAADPDANVLFSVHMYARWNDPELMAPELAATRDAGLAIIVGEFGWDFNEGINNLFCRVDAPRLLAETEALGVGWLAWSWFGNNAENAWLDLTDDGTLATLTDWGRLIVDGDHGLRTTARPAGIFGARGPDIR